ncbi:MAG: hypothetical protein ACHQUC_07235 [Chlamydiales bacterium]
MKKITLKILFASFLFISSSSYGAMLQSMTKDQMERAFINKTCVSVPIDNLNGQTIHNTFSIYVDNQGTITGKMSLKPKDEPQTDKGAYTIGNDGIMYITWQHWDSGKQLSAVFFETVNAYIGIDSDNIFHTVFMKEDIQSGNQLESVY